MSQIQDTIQMFRDGGLLIVTTREDISGLEKVENLPEILVRSTITPGGDIVNQVDQKLITDDHLRKLLPRIAAVHGTRMRAAIPDFANAEKWIDRVSKYISYIAAGVTVVWEVVEDEFPNWEAITGFVITLALYFGRKWIKQALQWLLRKFLQWQLRRLFNEASNEQEKPAEEYMETLSEILP